MAIKSFLLATCCVLIALANAAPDNTNAGFGLSNLPGARTASGIMASATDGMSRYLAPDGPIQPAITAIAGMPVRATEMANNQITRLSSGLRNGAQRLSQAAGQNGQIRMPGMDTAASMMPNSFSQIGNQLQGMIQAKNKFIMGQAERGIQAANRMGQSMRQGLQVRSSGAPNPMEHAGQMMSQMHETMNKSGKQIKNQLEQALQGTMGRMKSMQGMGSNIGKQVQGYGRTLSNGAQMVVKAVQSTGEQLMSQVQKNHDKNMSGMGGMLNSLQGSMGQMGQNMQKNLGGLQEHAQNAAQQLSQSFQSAAQLPMNMMQGLKSSMGGKGGMSSSGGRY